MIWVGLLSRRKFQQKSRTSAHPTQKWISVNASLDTRGKQHSEQYTMKKVKSHPNTLVSGWNIIHSSQLRLVPNLYINKCGLIYFQGDARAFFPQIVFRWEPSRNSKWQRNDMENSLDENFLLVFCIKGSFSSVFHTNQEEDRTQTDVPFFQKLSRQFVHWKIDSASGLGQDEKNYSDQSSFGFTTFHCIFIKPTCVKGLSLSPALSDPTSFLHKEVTRGLRPRQTP